MTSLFQPLFNPNNSTQDQKCPILFSVPIARLPDVCVQLHQGKFKTQIWIWDVKIRFEATDQIATSGSK